MQILMFWKVSRLAIRTGVKCVTEATWYEAPFPERLKKHTGEHPDVLEWYMKGENFVPQAN